MSPRLRWLIVAGVLMGSPGLAQEPSDLPFVADAALDSDVESKCADALVAVLQPLVDPIMKGGRPDEERQADYERVFGSVAPPSECRSAQRTLLPAIFRSGTLALSKDAPATNPASLALAERGGTIEDVAVALRNQDFVSSDGSAVTLRLNSATVFCPTGRSVNCPWDRLTGTVTFGSKIPEKELVGFSGIPDPEHLLDVLVWDANIRLIGDRRPDSPEWRGEWDDLAGEIWGLQKFQDSRLFGDLAQEGPRRELGVYTAALNAEVVRRFRKLENSVRSSWLVTIGFSGQHLTTEAGKNKYTALVTADKGFGPAAFTFNGSYASVADVVVADGPPVTLKTWKITAALSGDFMTGALVKGRSTEWTLAGRLAVPMDGDDVPVERKHVHDVSLSLKFPVTETTQVPISITFTNDPSNISKQKYVRGQVGIDYDFGALRDLFKSKS